MQHSPTEIKEKLLQALDKEYNVVDMAAVMEIIAILERTTITKEALETTRLGKYINELRRKTTDELLAKRAKDLVRRWRSLIQESNHTPSGSGVSVNSHNGPNHAVNAGGGVNQALRSNVSSALPQHIVSSSRLQQSASPVGRRVISPANSFSSVKSQSPNLHHLQSSSSGSTDGTSKLKFSSSALNLDSSNHQFHTNNTVNIDPVPKTYASNKRLRKSSPTSDIVQQSKRRNNMNGRMFPSLPDLHGDGSRDSISGLSQSSSSCELIPTHNKVPISELTANTSATLSTSTTVTNTVTTAVTSSVVCTSVISSSVTSTVTADTVITKYKEEEEEEEEEDYDYNSAVAVVITPTVSPTDSSTSTRTSATTTAIATTSITSSTATTVPSSGFRITNVNSSRTAFPRYPRVSKGAATNVTKTSIIDSSAVTAKTDSGTLIESPKTRTQKRRARLVCMTDSTCVMPPVLVDDIVKEKIASKVRTPKVKTTKELVASVQGKSSSFDIMPEDELSNSNVPMNKTSLTKESITVKYRSPADALEMTRTKSEHIAKFLRSQSELHHMQEVPSIVPLAEVDEEFRLQKQLGGSQVETSIENYNSSPAEMSSMTKDAQQSLSSKDSLCASVVGTNVHDKTVEEILAQLPPVDLEAICWDDTTDDTDSKSSVKQEVTQDIITKLHSQHIEGLNGNINEGAKPGETDFREWHETVSKKSYQGEFLHILPYVVID